MLFYFKPHNGFPRRSRESKHWCAFFLPGTKEKRQNELLSILTIVCCQHGLAFSGVWQSNERRFSAITSFTITSFASNTDSAATSAKEFVESQISSHGLGI